MGIPTLYSVGPASGTYTASPTANRIGVYMYGGASGGGNNGGGNGGGFGFYNKPITQPFSQPYSVGAAGNGAYASYGNAGGATSITNVGTANGAPGAANGNAPGAALTYPTRDFVVGGNFGTGNDAQQPGNSGVLVVFENTGT